MMAIDRFGIGALGLAALVGGALAWGAWHDGVDARLERAGELAFESRYAEAAGAYRAIIAALDRDEDRRPWVEAHARLGELTWVGLSDPRGAAEIYRSLVAEAPQADESWLARERLAEIADSHLGDLHEAIAHWQALAASGRARADSFAFRAAKAYFRLGEYEQSRKECEALAERSPEGEWTDDALLLIGTAWQFEGDHDEAVAAFEIAEARFPESEIAPRARYQIGQSRASQRDWESAQAALLTALETHPDPWRVQAELARVQRHLAEQRKIHPLPAREALAR